MLPRRLASRIFASYLVLTIAAVMVAGLVVPERAGVLAALTLVLLALAAVLTYDLVRALMRPVDELARTVRRITRGDFSARAEVPQAEELAGVISPLTEMSAQLRAKVEEVADERDRAKQIVDALDSGVLLLDADGTLRQANPAAQRWLGLSDRHLGLPAARALGVPEIFTLAEETAAGGQPRQAEATIVFPETRTVAVHAFPLRERGLTTGVVVTLIDLTGRRRLEALRRDFVANASHELKTPVAAIAALAETLDSALEEDPETARAFVGRIGREAGRLQRLVADLLDLSKVERGELAREPIDLAGLVGEAAGRWRERAGERRIDLRVQVQPGATVRGDRAQLELLVSNLLDNALRYTDPGGTVWLRLSRDNGHAVIAVEDTGHGIPQRDLPRVFERFYRIDKARDRQTGGTGLGLAIVRHVAESHGGQVAVTSELGRGSTFTATIPTSNGN